MLLFFWCFRFRVCLLLVFGCLAWFRCRYVPVSKSAHFFSFLFDSPLVLWKFQSYSVWLYTSVGALRMGQMVGSRDGVERDLIAAQIPYSLDADFTTSFFTYHIKIAILQYFPVSTLRVTISNHWYY